MGVESISRRRRVIGLGLAVLGGLFACRIAWLCRLRWTDHYGEESRNRMVLWFWLSSAIVAAGYGIAFRSRAARRLALALALFAFVAMYSYPYLFAPPKVPY
jgi:hypothetical protein